jgi:outer membrane lipoprotein SlyB
MLIEVVPRSGTSGGEMSSGSMGASGASGTSASGTSGAAGVTGSSATGDRVYRVTLRMDDGSTRLITQDATPDFRSGDRVNLTSGAIAH